MASMTRPCRPRIMYPEVRSGSVPGRIVIGFPLRSRAQRRRYPAGTHVELPAVDRDGHVAQVRLEGIQVDSHPETGGVGHVDLAVLIRDEAGAGDVGCQ